MSLLRNLFRKRVLWQTNNDIPEPDRYFDIRLVRRNSIKK